jgi:hypothetical protein
MPVVFPEMLATPKREPNAVNRPFQAGKASREGLCRFVPYGIPHSPGGADPRAHRRLRFPCP